jgi:two-component system cell cycle response regulator DivK
MPQTLHGTNCANVASRLRPDLPSAAVEGLNVLLVEDNAKNLKLARDLLGFRGITVTEATTGAEALEAVGRTGPPDVALLDIDLPDMTGVQLLAALRELDGFDGVPAVAVTAYAMKGDAERLLAEGFDAYISKPLDVRTFADTVVAVATGPQGDGEGSGER